jgi:predicted anti-sigma-YlaC factor YlaD
MRCERCELWLHEVLDGIEPDGALLEHLAGCPECRELYESTLTLTREMRQMPRPQPPEGMTDRIVAGVLYDRRRRERRQIWVRVGAVAAAVLVALLAWQFWPRPEVEPTPLVKKDPEPETPPSLRQTVVNAGSVVVDEAKRQVDEVVESTRSLLSAFEGPILPPMDVESPLEPAERSLKEAGQGVTTSLEPVAGSAKRAFALFVRDLSPGPSKGKPGL